MSLRRRLPAPAAFFAFPALAALAAVLAILSIPADPKNSVVLGYSLSRLAVAGGLLAAGLGLGWLAVQLGRKPGWSARLEAVVLQNRRALTGLVWLSGGLLLAGWIFNFLPLYRFGALQAPVERLRPATIWLTVFAGETFLALAARRNGLHWKRLGATLTAERRGLWAAAGLLAAFLTVWGLMAATGMGVLPGEDIWYEAGAPLLGLQALGAGALGLAAVWAENRIFGKNSAFAAGSAGGKRAVLAKRLDLLVFAAIWAVSALVWAKEPLQSTFFAPGPYPPNNAYYPYSDAVSFDAMSQYALLGQGIRNGTAYDRSLYPAFLVGIHLIAGQDYARAAALQAALFAALPGLVYLTGKRLFNRPAGVTAAAMTTLRGVNAIAAATWINGANPKLFLTDFFTAVGMALLVWTLVRWMQDGWPRLRGAIWIGGLTGLLSMARTNVLIAAPFAMLLPVGAHLRQWRRWLAAGLVFMLAFLAAVTPWSLRNMQHGQPYLGAYLKRLEVVQEKRYQTAPAADTTAGPQGEGQAARTESAGLAAKALNTASFVTDHFLHNLATSTLILPTSPALDDLFHTVRGALPYWNAQWEGQMPAGALPLLGLNLAVLALGAAFAWRRAGAAGLAPAAVFVGYMLSNGLARASGGRYIVPVDWVVVMYFVFGLAQVAIWVGAAFGRSAPPSGDALAAKEAERPEGGRDRWRSAALLLAFLALGALPALAEGVFPERYAAKQTKAQLTAEMAAAFERAGYSQAEVGAFAADENSFVVRGRLLYPRYLTADEGLPGDARATRARAYPRLTFTVLGPEGQANIVLPMEAAPGSIPDGADVWAAGCKVKKVRLAALVLVQQQDDLLVRGPHAPLVCPPPEGE